MAEEVPENVRKRLTTLYNALLKARQENRGQKAAERRYKVACVNSGWRVWGTPAGKKVFAWMKITDKAAFNSAISKIKGKSKVRGLVSRLGNKRGIRNQKGFAGRTSTRHGRRRR